MSNKSNKKSLLQRIGESQVWTSIIRSGVPRTRRQRMHAILGSVFLHLHPARLPKHAVKLDPKIIHCLLAANRYEKLAEINDAIEKNSVLVMNRYYQSNWVYGLVNGLKLDWLEKLDSDLPKADLVILLDVSQQESFKRKKTNRDKFEKNKAFYKKIAETYRNLAKNKHWKVVDATKDKNEVHEDIMKIFQSKMIK